MAGTPWDFTVIPSTITEVTVTDGTTTETLQEAEIGPGKMFFTTGSFAETSNVTVSATGYASKTVVVGTATIDLTPYVSSITKGGTTYQLKDSAATTALSTKADTDLSNVNATGTSTAAGWGMPSTTYQGLTLGASGSNYTAPANGWFMLYFYQITQGYVHIYNQTTQFEAEHRETVNGTAVSAYIPVRKNDVVNITYDVGGPNTFRFYYAEGSKSEAN